MSNRCNNSVIGMIIFLLSLTNCFTEQSSNREQYNRNQYESLMRTQQQILNNVKKISLIMDLYEEKLLLLETQVNYLLSFFLIPSLDTLQILNRNATHMLLKSYPCATPNFLKVI